MNTGTSAQKDFNKVKTVFIVEDDYGVGTFLVEAIQQETCYHAVLASDGFQALKILPTLKPDLVLLDYGLPGMNGLEFYDTIHTIKALKDLPVLIISAESKHIQKEITARQLPLLPKPFALTDLLEAIERLCS